MQYPLYGLSIFQRPFLLLDVISVAKRTQPDCSFQCSLQSSCEIISEMLNSSLKEDLEVSFSVMNCRRFFEILLYFFFCTIVSGNHFWVYLRVLPTVSVTVSPFFFCFFFVVVVVAVFVSLRNDAEAL